MISLITCTGGRAEAFALCERWMGRQTFLEHHSFEWIVVDDGPEPTPVTMGQTVVRPEPFWKPGEITLNRNLLAALPHVRTEKILFIEDDDWYGPGYVEAMAAALDWASLAGDIPARYYNVATRQYREIGNTFHASLCQTGIRAEMLPLFEDLCGRRGPFLDLELFRAPAWFARTEQSAGMKGLPGRAGIGIGHRPRARWPQDPDLTVLREWIGEDVEAYAGYWVGEGQ